MSDVEANNGELSQVEEKSWEDLVNETFIFIVQDPIYSNLLSFYK